MSGGLIYHDDCFKSLTAETLNAVTTSLPCNIQHGDDYSVGGLVKYIENLNVHQEVLAPLLKALARHAYSKLSLPRDVKLTVELKFSERFPTKSQRKSKYVSVVDREEVLKARTVRRKEKAKLRRQVRAAKKRLALEAFTSELRVSTEQERGQVLASKLDKRSRHHAKRNQRAIKTLSRLSRHYLACVPSSVLKFSDDHEKLAEAANTLQLPFVRLDRERKAAEYRRQQAAARCAREEAKRFEDQRSRDVAQLKIFRERSYAILLNRGYFLSTYLEFVRDRSHLSWQGWKELYEIALKAETSPPVDDYRFEVV